MTKICIVRHGQTDWNKERRLQGRTDIDLNETGERQAADAREYLHNEEWDVIITSPLKRAKRTAEIINERLQLPLLEMEEFAERYFGEAEGLLIEESRRKYPNGGSPGQESREEVVDRAIRGVEEIQQRFPDKNVLLVAHGALIGLLLAELSPGEFVYGETRLVNACINTIHFQDNKWNLKEYNQIGHLSEV
ncbi:histidine phosphatase family protein [Rossellomorea vietnamensis]|uniref:Histidine phosphatase family protein n=1 Tax=Rossellomorea vietnamensis TaxID=218284 RepID=A0A5D4KCR0_9BACI|nr:histidine phosphatase family protein [Rossellomorea vietnamensis]TYR73933.1 histidine phosphatase family protein [Rossellomorea vietnamensis]